MDDFNKFYEQTMKELGSTQRRDPLGNRIEVPYGASYKQGLRGKGKAIKHGNKAKLDRLGNVHEIPPGHELKMGSDGKGLVVRNYERVIEKDGKLVRPDKKKP